MIRKRSTIRSNMARAAAVAAALGMTALGALAEAPPEGRVNFVSCPIVRDTKTVPCWLSEYEGELYYLGIQTDISSDFDPPYLGHPVLVEGVLSDAPRICGGIVLEPVIVSPMAEFDANCNTILPAEDRYTVPFAPRPPGPSGGRLAFQRPPPEKEVLAPPYEAREFDIFYDFDALIMGRHSGLLARVLEYATAIDSKKIVVTGSSGGVLLSDGSTIVENESISKKRASEVAHILATGGLGKVDFEVAVKHTAHPDGVDDWRARRTTIRVLP